MKFALLALVAVTAAGQNICSSLPLGLTYLNGDSFAGFTPFPSSDWYTDISAATPDTNSANIISDFWTAGMSGWRWNYPPSTTNVPAWGAPHEEGRWVHVVDSTYPLSTVVIDGSGGGSGQSDPGPFPVPRYPRLSGIIGPYQREDYSAAGDKVLIVIDKTKCIVHEFWNVQYSPAGITAGAVATFDLTESTDQQRPYLFNSASVSGRSLLPGIVKSNELSGGTIGHAVVITGLGVSPSLSFVHNASNHQYGGTWSADRMPFGSKMRLKASFDCTTLTNATAQTLCATAKKYGFILVDGQGNSTPGVQSTVSDSLTFAGTFEWLSNAGLQTSSNWEVMALGTVYCDALYTCGHQPPTGSAPTVASFSASPSTITLGQSTTLTWSGVSGASSRLRWVTPSVGPGTGPLVSDSPITVTPVATGSVVYTLRTCNLYGCTTSTTTVTVL